MQFLKSIDRKRLAIYAGIALGILAVAFLAGLAAYGITRSLALGVIQAAQIGGPALVEGQPTPAPGETRTPGEFNQPLAPEVEPDLAPWDGAGRVTVLLLGLDFRDWESGSDYSRSDTMILLTLDPLSNTAGILSIPRDLWVGIPGFQHGKINTAYYLGDAYKLPGGGPGLAVKTVEQFLGVPINYYAQIDFGAFVRFIDEIGGVKINVPEPITVDLLGSGSATKKKLQPGVQVLPGEWTLAYARARYTEGGDFDRGSRQRQVILAIRDRILSFDMLPVLTSRADVLYQELSSGVHTNMSLQEVIQLALLAKDVPEENIIQGGIDEKYVIFGQSPDNLSILIPLPDKIHALRDQIFVSDGALGPQTPGSLAEQVVAEAARVAIVNGSRSGGLAERTSEYLKTQGVNAASAGDGEATTVTTLYLYNGRPFTARYLADLMKIPAVKIVYAYDPANSVDLTVVLGEDWARSNPLP